MDYSLPLLLTPTLHLKGIMDYSLLVGKFHTSSLLSEYYLGELGGRGRIALGLGLGLRSGLRSWLGLVSGLLLGLLLWLRLVARLGMGLELEVGVGVVTGVGTGVATGSGVPVTPPCAYSPQSLHLALALAYP